MTALKSADDIFTTELKEIYSAERQLSRAIPKMTKKVSSDRLRQMLEQRQEQGTALIEELDAALEAMKVPKVRPKNIAAEGLIEDVNQHLEEIEDEKLRDPALLASMQKIEHYCIAAWGTAGSLGRLLGQDEVTKVMDRVLEEGRTFDEEMTKLAEDEVNPRMIADNEPSEDEEPKEDEVEAKGEKGRRGRTSH